MSTVRLMDVGVPSVTVTIVVAGARVPEEALMVVVQMPLTFAAGVTNPDALIFAQVFDDELHNTFPDRSFVDPSLKVPVADICRVWTGFAVMVWFCGPMASDDNVGLTKKPVHPAATASVRSAAVNKIACLELRIIGKPLNRDVAIRS